MYKDTYTAYKVIHCAKYGYSKFKYFLYAYAVFSFWQIKNKIKIKKSLKNKIKKYWKLLSKMRDRQILKRQYQRNSYKQVTQTFVSSHVAVSHAYHNEQFQETIK